MSTARSWTDLRPGALRRDLADLRALLAFRFGGSGRLQARGKIGLGVVGAITGLMVLGPAHVDPTTIAPELTSQWLHEQLRGFLPAFLTITLLSSIASGGGRELLAREQAVAFPISPAVDHLGALLLAPLNLAWFVQSWLLLAAASFLGGPGGLIPSVTLALLWMLVATALAQAAGWAVEWVRRGPHGRSAVIALAVGAGLLLAALQATGRLGPVVAALPTGSLADAMAATATSGFGGSWAGWLLGLLVAAGLAVLAGMPLADAVSRRPTRDVERADSRRHTPRPDPAHDGARGIRAVLLRQDRANVLRSVPLRRGLLLLVLMPGLGSLAMPPDWGLLTLVVGMVCSGAALLFGVNAWGIDGRGQLWRESLPVAPQLVFDVRARLLVETLGCAALATLGLAVWRMGAPTAAQAFAMAVMLVVVVVQVTATALRWSVLRPHTANMRSSRAIPAPPLAMMGYSARLALSTTFTGMLFSGLGALGQWRLVVIVAAPMLIWSAVRWWHARRAWARSDVRALVTVTVAA